MIWHQLGASFYEHRLGGRLDLYDVDFDVPLVSHIFEDLWVGGCIAGLALPHEFRQVVSLYPECRYQLRRDIQLHEVALDDLEVAPDGDLVETAAACVVDALAAGPTLVHCQVGLNRAPLVAAVALMRQMTAQDAISLLRERRSPAVLCNTMFERWLLDPEARA